MAAATVCLLVSVAAPAAWGAGKSVKYGGIHPLPPHSGAFCYIDFLHVHAQAPSDMRGYRLLPDQVHLFVGDEVALGYAGTRHAYFGPHPVSAPGLTVNQPLFCYLRAAHFHANPPAPASSYVQKDGVAWFTGTFPPEFERDRFNIWVNDVHPIAGYTPPPVDLSAAPPGYHLPVTVAPPAPPPAAPVAAAPANGTKGAGPSRGVRTPSRTAAASAAGGAQ